jgi:hypothetical protein
MPVYPGAPLTFAQRIERRGAHVGVRIQQAGQHRVDDDGILQRLLDLQCGRVSVQVVLILRDRASGDTEASLRNCGLLASSIRILSAEAFSLRTPSSPRARFADRSEVLEEIRTAARCTSGMGESRPSKHLLLQLPAHASEAERRSRVQHLA